MKNKQELYGGWDISMGDYEIPETGTTPEAERRITLRRIFVSVGAAAIFLSALFLFS